MTHPTSALIFAVGIIAQAESNRNENQENEIRRSVVNLLPDIARFLRSYNRLMSQGNLKDQRPYIARRFYGYNRRKNNQHKKMDLAVLVKPITDLMSPLGNILEPILGKKAAANATTTAPKLAEKPPEDKKVVTEAPKRRAGAKQPKSSKNLSSYAKVQATRGKLSKCHGRCPSKKSPICITNGKKFTEFSNKCEYFRRVMCCNQVYEKWEVHSRGPCPLNELPFAEKKSCPAV